MERSSATVAVPMTICVTAIGGAYAIAQLLWNSRQQGAIYLDSILLIAALIGVFGATLFACITRWFPAWDQSWTERSGYAVLGAIVVGSACTSGACVPSIVLGGLFKALPLLPLYIGGALGTRIGLRLRKNIDSTADVRR